MKPEKNKTHLSLNILLMLLITLISTTTQAIVPQAERDALVALYNSTDGANWTDNSNWLVGDPCDGGWFGVSCGVNTVNILSLGENNLIGQIPISIADLNSLTGLYLHLNQLNGSIPIELGTLTNLKNLWLFSNQLNGSIPVEFSNLSNLEYLLLSKNQISGGIPSGFGNLVKLIRLDLDSNQLTGAIPIELSNLTTWLRTLNLSSNKLSGSIPPELGNLTLLHLLLSSNQFTGNIPSEIGTITTLRGLNVKSNKLTGILPDSLLNLTLLSNGYWGPGLDLDFNGFYTNNTALDVFLDSKQAGGDWSITQTIAPANLSNTNTTASTISLTWDLIEYTQDSGRYHIWYSESPTGPYLDGGATNSKTENSFTLTGLTENTNYYIVVRTESDVSPVNQNMIISGDSNQVMTTTLQSSQSSIVTGQITDWQESSGTITVGDGINHVTFYWSTASANSGWFYGSSTSQNPDSDIAFLDGVTDINQVGDISNILFNGGSIGTFCDIDCDPDGVGDFMIGINVNTGHLAVLRIDNIISRQMNATWWFQKNITNFFDSIFSNNFE